MFFSLFLTLVIKGGWNIVRTSPTGYQPWILPGKNSLDNLLHEQSIINQTTMSLTGEQTEILALGLAFIPSFSDKNDSIQKTIDIETWSRKLDTALYFSNQVNNESRPLKGWLNKDIPSDWLPPAGSWRDDSNVNNLINNCLITPSLNEPYVTPLPIRNAINSLRENKFIHILKADKGSNAVIWLVEDYDKEAQRQLDDVINYKELTRESYESELRLLSQRITTQAHRLYDLGFITKRERDLIGKAPPFGSYIYFLPKIHKKLQPDSQTFAGRPIVATHSAVIHLLDKFITRVTSPLLARIPGSLKDTYDFLNKLPKEAPFKNTALITADVDALYPNIPWKEGIDASIIFYKDNLTWLREYASENGLLPPPNVSSFAYAIELVLTSSYINFKNRRWFHQIRGTAMGMCISVYFANAYMYRVTKVYLDFLPPQIHTFLRFIDDVFIICDASPPDVNKNSNLLSSSTGLLKDSPFFTNISNESIHYTTEGPSLQQSFLDVLVSVVNIDNRIETAPYKKPSSSNTYLHATSNHPGHTFRSIPFAQFQRLRRISSSTQAFKNSSTTLIYDLIKCGYKKRDIWTGYNRVLNESRYSIAPSKLRHNSISSSFKLITRHNLASSTTISHTTLSQIHEAARLHYVHQNYTAQNNTIANRAHCLGRSSSSIVTNVGRNVGSYFTKTFKNPK